MKKSINLSSGRKKVDTALRKIFIITVVAFIAMVIISLILLAYRLFLKSNYDNLESKEQELNEKLLRLEEKKSKITETKLRIVDVRKVLSKRAPTTIRINTISSFILEDIEINRLSGKDNEMSFDIQSDSIATLNLLLEQKIEEIAADKKTGIKKIIMKRFGLSPKTLTYSVSFTVQFK